jgi:hypothetical protein
MMRLRNTARRSINAESQRIQQYGFQIIFFQRLNYGVVLSEVLIILQDSLLSLPGRY